jgi:hypothetical protein
MRVAIIGGGAAGMMAAATIAETSPDAEVVLIEKNDSLGKKVIISGGGRCNVTTGLDDVKEVLTRYPRGGKFLTKAMYAFPPKAMREWMEDHGVPMKIEKDGRAFPQSDDGRDVVRVFLNIFKKANVKVLYKATVEDIKKTKSGFEVKIKNKDKVISFDKIILTTGGQAYRQTGSAGDGYAFAVKLGHSITPLAPSLSAFHTKETWLAKLAGLSFAKVKLEAKAKSDQIKKYVMTGPMMFTHKGITGPAVFAMSSLVAFEKITADNPIKITIDLFPEETLDRINNKFASLIKNNPKKNLVSVLSLMITKSMAGLICDEIGLDPTKTAGQLSKKEMGLITAGMKNVVLHIIARAAGEEFVTAGGVCLNEVDPKTMESKKCHGLYLAGEILDIDGFTGGFNLQSAWATARAAAS